MGEFRLTPRAESDLDQIWFYIASQNENAADRVLNGLFDRMAAASAHPAMGAPRPHLSRTARILIEGRYIVIYEPASYGILVVAIVHSRRAPETGWTDRDLALFRHPGATRPASLEPGPRRLYVCRT